MVAALLHDLFTLCRKAVTNWMGLGYGWTNNSNQFFLQLCGKMLPGPSASDIPATTRAPHAFAWNASHQWRSQRQQHLQGKVRGIGKPLSSCAPRVDATLMLSLKGEDWQKLPGSLWFLYLALLLHLPCLRSQEHRVQVWFILQCPSIKWYKLHKLLCAKGFCKAQVCRRLVLLWCL